MLKNIVENQDEIALHYVNLEDLEGTFLDGNSKKHDPNKIIESILRYGFRDPIAFDPALNDGKGGIVEGNGRLEAVAEMRSRNMNIPRGLKDNWAVPVLFGVNSTTEAEAIAYSIEHNWSVLWGSDADLEQMLSMFEESALTEQLKVLDGENSLPLSVEEDLDELLQSLDFRDEESEGTDRGDPEAIPNLNEVEPKVKRGEVWQLGKHRLACIDSTDEKAVKEFLGDRAPSFIWADPPYGVNIVKTKEGFGSTNAAKPFGSKIKKGSVGAGNACAVGVYPEIIGDNTIDTAIASYNLCQRISKGDNCLIFWGANYYAHKLPATACWIVWDKRDGATSNNFADAEIAWTNQTTPTRVFAHLWNGMIKASEKGEKRVHPTQKPVALFNWCAERYGKTEDFIFDPFLGSGISIIGAEQLGDRICYGCELSEHYCDVIIKRWEDFTGGNAKKIGDID